MRRTATPNRASVDPSLASGEASFVPQEEVRELAEALSRRLEDEGELDEHARASLELLRDRVEAALSGNNATAASEPSAEARSLVERFERDHPDLTALIQRLADALSNAGL